VNKRAAIYCLVWTLWVAPVAARAGQAAAGSWKAGAARRVITPQQPMWMAGYASRNHPAEGRSTDLFCKALLLEDPRGHRGLVITLDLVGIDATLASRWCEEIHKRWKLTREQIVLCTSHTHSGPVIVANLKPLHFELLSPEQQQRALQYVRHLTDQVLGTVEDAMQSVQPASLSWGSGRATFAVNRRNNPAAEVPARRKAGKLVGPFDHDVPVLAVKDGSGRLKAVLFGYACHATTLAWYYWSGDYPGHAQLTLEQRYPECVALFWAGCGGDQNPLPRRTCALAQRYGTELADAVDEVLLSKKMQPISGNLTTRFVTFPLAFSRVPTRKEIEGEKESKNRYVAARAKMWLARLDQGQQVPSTYPYPIGYWKLGEQVEWFSLGGEVVVDYALRLKDERNGVRTWVAGYSHDVMAYIPSRRVLSEGGYEGGGAMVYYGFFSPWSETVETDIINQAQQLAGSADHLRPIDQR